MTRRYSVELMFYGNRHTARCVSHHRSLDAAVRASVRVSKCAAPGWGVRVFDAAGCEVDLWPEYRRLGIR